MNTLMRYAAVIEQGEKSFGAYVPDLPGCVAAAETFGEVEQLIREAIEFHIEGLRQDGAGGARTCHAVRAEYQFICIILSAPR
jgi:predicted RNase H-like HicB family nuclease